MHLRRPWFVPTIIFPILTLLSVMSKIICALHMLLLSALPKLIRALIHLLRALRKLLCAFL
jgi:hypothetical protein